VHVSDDLEHRIASLREKLNRERYDARTQISSGVLMIALVPLVVMASVWFAGQSGDLGALVALLVAPAYTLIGTVGGAAMIAGGAIEHHRLGNQLDDCVHTLPAARIVTAAARSGFRPQRLSAPFLDRSCDIPYDPQHGLPRR
jgi:hypothetical protein